MAVWKGVAVHPESGRARDRGTDGQAVPDKARSTKEEEGFTWMAVHAPENVPDAPSLLADNRVVFGSSEDVLVPGWHKWSNFDSENRTWQELGEFETKFLP